MRPPVAYFGGKSRLAPWIISGYPSPLYDELYAGWARLERQVLCRVSNGRAGPNHYRTEVLWSNRPLDEGRLTFTATPNTEEVPA